MRTRWGMWGWVMGLGRLAWRVLPPWQASAAMHRFKQCSEKGLVCGGLCGMSPLHVMKEHGSIISFERINREMRERHSGCAHRLPKRRSRWPDSIHANHACIWP